MFDLVDGRGEEAINSKENYNINLHSSCKFDRKLPLPTTGIFRRVFSTSWFFFLIEVSNLKEIWNIHHIAN
jgi:hypothetical protein